jgi:hypothetical protein
MKLNKSFIGTFILLIIVAALYRIIPGRPLGFAPQIAMALFSGAIIKDKKWAFALPVFSMFISDLLYQLLYVNGLSDIPGFYKGQVTNYALFAGITLLGFLVKKVTVLNIFIYSLLAPTVYFLISNFLVWAGGGGFKHPKTAGGLLLTYIDGLPFYKGALMATVLFSGILFGAYYLLKKEQVSNNVAAE